MSSYSQGPRSGQKRSYATAPLSLYEEEPNLNCELARGELSAYIERETAAAAKAELEAHLLVCEICQSELDFMRLLVAGLRSLPAVRPPLDFKSRVLARWDDEKCETVAVHLVSLPQTDPAEPAAVTLPAVDPSPGTSRHRPSLTRPSPINRYFHGLAAALVAVIFAVGMLTGRAYFSLGWVRPAGVLPDAASLHDMADKVRRAVDLRIESAALIAPHVDSAPTSLPAPGLPQTDPAECAGPPQRWNQTNLHVVVRPPLQQSWQEAEVAVWVPENVRIAFDSNEYSAGQLVLIHANVGENGEWHGALRWQASRPGRYPAWVETRCGPMGMYQHRPIVFNAAP